MRSFASISTPSRYIAWLGEIHRSRRGTPSSSAPALMQTRQDLRLAKRELAAIAAPRDPLDRPRLSRAGDQSVADAQALDRHLAVLGQDQCAAAVAGVLGIDEEVWIDRERHRVSAAVGQLEIGGAGCAGVVAIEGQGQKTGMRGVIGICGAECGAE